MPLLSSVARWNQQTTVEKAKSVLVKGSRAPVGRNRKPVTLICAALTADLTYRIRGERDSAEREERGERWK